MVGRAARVWLGRPRGSAFVRTGCGKDDRGEAEKILAAYIVEKHAPEPANDPLIADVMNVYATEAAPHLKTAKKIAHHIDSGLGVVGREKGVRGHRQELPRLRGHQAPANGARRHQRAQVGADLLAQRFRLRPAEYHPDLLAAGPQPATRALADPERGRAASLGGAALPAHPPLHPARSLHRLAVWCPAGDAMGSDRSRRSIRYRGCP